MHEMLSRYRPIIQRYSVDESFMDCSSDSEISRFPVKTAFSIKEKIKKNLSFTVHIGIGVLAPVDPNFLRIIPKSYGQLVHDYANGIHPSPVIINEDAQQKSLGNSLTLSYDGVTKEKIFQEAFALYQRIGMRLPLLRR